MPVEAQDRNWRPRSAMNALLLTWMARSDCIARSYASSASSESCPWRYCRRGRGSVQRHSVVERLRRGVVATTKGNERQSWHARDPRSQSDRGYRSHLSAMVNVAREGRMLCGEMKLVFEARMHFLQRTHRSAKTISTSTLSQSAERPSRRKAVDLDSFEIQPNALSDLRFRAALDV